MRLASSVCTFSGAVITSTALLACSSSGGANPNALPAPKGVAALPPLPTGLGGGTLELSASGEVLSLGGFPFPPSSAGDTFMVDGWKFTLYRYLTVFSNVTIWDNPNLVPTDQSQHGAAVATVAGPWVADLHKGGPLMGKGGGGEQAVPFGAILGMDDGGSFDPTVTYGFGFSTIAATADVYNVNLDAKPGPDGLNDLDEYDQVMIPNGYSVLYEGIATYVGDPSCNGKQTSGSVSYDFSQLPTSLPFRLGFSTPTDYVNCQNGTDLPGAGVDGEDHPRGVQFNDTQSIVAQVTIHMDHPFWESFAENSPLHWDQIAAQYVGVTSPVAKTEDLKGVDFTAFTDKAGAKLPWRSCVPATYYTPTGTGQLAFDPLKVNVTIGGSDPAKGLRDYYDFIRYTQATQGHLNSQGLCYIARQYPSPPGGS